MLKILSMILLSAISINTWAAAKSSEDEIYTLGLIATQNVFSQRGEQYDKSLIDLTTLAFYGALTKGVPNEKAANAAIAFRGDLLGLIGENRFSFKDSNFGEYVKIALNSLMLTPVGIEYKVAIQQIITYLPVVYGVTDKFSDFLGKDDYSTYLVRSYRSYDFLLKNSVLAIKSAESGFKGRNLVNKILNNEGPKYLGIDFDLSFEENLNRNPQFVSNFNLLEGINMSKENAAEAVRLLRKNEINVDKIKEMQKKILDELESRSNDMPSDASDESGGQEESQNCRLNDMPSDASDESEGQGGSQNCQDQDDPERTLGQSIRDMQATLGVLYNFAANDDQRMSIELVLAGYDFILKIIAPSKVDDPLYVSDVEKIASTANFALTVVGYISRYGENSDYLSTNLSLMSQYIKKMNFDINKNLSNISLSLRASTASIIDALVSYNGASQNSLKKISKNLEIVRSELSGFIETYDRDMQYVNLIQPIQDVELDCNSELAVIENFNKYAECIKNFSRIALVLSRGDIAINQDIYYSSNKLFNSNEKREMPRFIRNLSYSLYNASGKTSIPPRNYVNIDVLITASNGIVNLQNKYPQYSKKNKENERKIRDAIYRLGQDAVESLNYISSGVVLRGVWKNYAKSINMMKYLLMADARQRALKDLYGIGGYAFDIFDDDKQWNLITKFQNRSPIKWAEPCGQKASDLEVVPGGIGDAASLFSNGFADRYSINSAGERVTALSYEVWNKFYANFSHTLGISPEQTYANWFRYNKMYGIKSCYIVSWKAKPIEYPQYTFKVSAFEYPKVYFVLIAKDDPTRLTFSASGRTFMKLPIIGGETLKTMTESEKLIINKLDEDANIIILKPFQCRSISCDGLSQISSDDDIFTLANPEVIKQINWQAFWIKYYDAMNDEPIIKYLPKEVSSFIVGDLTFSQVPSFDDIDQERIIKVRADFLKRLGRVYEESGKFEDNLAKLEYLKDIIYTSLIFSNTNEMDIVSPLLSRSDAYLIGRKDILDRINTIKFNDSKYIFDLSDYAYPIEKFYFLRHVFYGQSARAKSVANYFGFFGPDASNK